VRHSHATALRPPGDSSAQGSERDPQFWPTGQLFYRENLRRDICTPPQRDILYLRHKKVSCTSNHGETISAPRCKTPRLQRDSTARLHGRRETRGQAHHARQWQTSLPCSPSHAVTQRTCTRTTTRSELDRLSPVLLTRTRTCSSCVKHAHRIERREELAQENLYQR